MKEFIYSLFYLPNIQTNFTAQVFRNYLSFSKNFTFNFLFLVFQPFLAYLAVGYGVGQMVDPIRNLTYLEFITPAFLILTGTFISFNEGYKNYNLGMNRTKIYKSILKTPMSEVEICFGEIIWATLKGVMATSLILVYSVVSTDISMTFNPLLLLFIFLNSFVFSCIGVLLAKFSHVRRNLNLYMISLFIPLSLICGSFFPLFRLPLALKQLSMFFPSTHFIFLIRKSYFDLYYSTYFASFGFCLMGSYVLLSYCLNKKNKS